MIADIRTRIFLPLTLGLAALTALTKITFDDADRLNYLPVVLLWIASGVACALTFAPTLKDVRRWWQAKSIARSDWLGVAALTLCGASFVSLNSVRFQMWLLATRACWGRRRC